MDYLGVSIDEQLDFDKNVSNHLRRGRRVQNQTKPLRMPSVHHNDISIFRESYTYDRDLHPVSIKKEGPLRESNPGPLPP